MKTRYQILILLITVFITWKLGYGQVNKIS